MEFESDASLDMAPDMDEMMSQFISQFIQSADGQHGNKS